jgi:hypothetical protein
MSVKQLPAVATMLFAEVALGSALRAQTPIEIQIKGDRPGPKVAPASMD